MKVSSLELQRMAIFKKRLNMLSRMRKAPQAKSLLNGGLITSLARRVGSLELTYLKSRSKS
jgi:hypothetical protein